MHMMNSLKKNVDLRLESSVQILTGVIKCPTNYWKQEERNPVLV